MLIALSSCSIDNSNTEFEKFSHHFKLIRFPFGVNDQLAFRNWDLKYCMDTNSIIRYDLLNQHAEKEYPLKNLKESKCSYVGRYESKNYTVLLYKAYTAGAGNGNPEMFLATFTKDGNKKDEIIALWSEAEDPLHSQRVILNIPDSSQIDIKSILKYNGFLKDKIVPKKTILRVLKYQIQKDGAIIKLQDISRNVFKDDNPLIMDSLIKE